jgi:hypothetical protein
MSHGRKVEEIDGARRTSHFARPQRAVIFPSKNSLASNRAYG